MIYKTLYRKYRPSGMLSLKADLFPELKHDQPASKNQAEHRKHMKIVVDKFIWKQLCF